MSESVLISGWQQVDVDTGKHESPITFAAGQRSEIGRYEVDREESLPGFGMGMTIDDFQIAGFRHDVTESLKSVL